jgi:hypothetical protein
MVRSSTLYVRACSLSVNVVTARHVRYGGPFRVVDVRPSCEGNRHSNSTNPTVLSANVSDDDTLVSQVKIPKRVVVLANRHPSSAFLDGWRTDHSKAFGE